MSTDSISPLRQRMIEDMNARKLCAGTQKGHIRSCRRFTAFLKRSPDTATAEDIRLFQLHLAETGMSICNRNRIMTGLRFLFRVTLRRLDLAAAIYHIREPQKIPLVMSPDETRRLLAVASSLKVRMLLSLGYGCGLRAGEVVRLKVKHIDSAQKIIRIEQSKGRKDRNVMLSAGTIDLLRQWWKVRPSRCDAGMPVAERWLFPGTKLGKPMTTRQLNRLFHEATDSPVLVVDPGMHTGTIWRADTDAGARWAVTGSQDKTVRVWSLTDGELLQTIRLPAGPGYVGQAFAVAIDPHGDLIAAGGWTRWTDDDRQQQIYLFDRASGALVSWIEGLPSLTNHLAFSPDGERLAASLGSVRGLRVYSRTQHWAESGRDTGYGGQSYWAAFAPDGRLATTALDGRVRLYASDSEGDLKPTVVIAAPSGRQPYSIAFNHDGTRLAVGYANSTAVDLLDGYTLAQLPGPDRHGIDEGDLSTVAWSRDGQSLFAAGAYGPIGSRPVIAWSDRGTGVRREMAAGHDTVNSLVPLPDNNLLVASADPWLARLRGDGSASWMRAGSKADFRDQYDKLRVSIDGIRIDFGFEQFGKARHASIFQRARSRSIRPPTAA